MVRAYCAELDRGAYTAAYGRWDRGGRASGQRLAAFRLGFAHTASTRVSLGTPSRLAGAAGSLYATVPVTVAARLRDGVRQTFVGSDVLRAPNRADAGADWRLYAGRLGAVGPAR